MTDGRSAWQRFVKQYQKENNVTYAQALTICSPMWKKPGVKEKYIASLEPKNVPAKKEKKEKRGTKKISYEEEAQKYKEKYKTLKHNHGAGSSKPSKSAPKKAKKKRIVYESDSSSSEEEVVVVRKKKKSAASKRKQPISDSDSSDSE